MPREVTDYGAAGERLLSGMRAAVVALLDAGNNVILDEMPVDATIMPAWRKALQRRHHRHALIARAPGGWLPGATSC